jgi:DNA-binding response OmpR family regulator
MSKPYTADGNDPARRRVLLVEDNDAAGKGLSKLLEAYGFEVRVVPDGASALAALQATPPPDYLLTDLQLPDLDGREVARRASGLDPAPRVALITGWDVNADPEEVARWGIDWVFSKPLDIRDLVAKLSEPSCGSTLPPNR